MPVPVELIGQLVAVFSSEECKSVPDGALWSLGQHDEWTMNVGAVQVAASSVVHASASVVVVAQPLLHVGATAMPLVPGGKSMTASKRLPVTGWLLRAVAGMSMFVALDTPALVNGTQVGCCPEHAFASPSSSKPSPRSRLDQTNVHGLRMLPVWTMAKVGPHIYQLDSRWKRKTLLQTIRPYERSAAVSHGEPSA